MRGCGKTTVKSVGRSLQSECSIVKCGLGVIEVVKEAQMNSKLVREREKRRIVNSVRPSHRA